MIWAYNANIGGMSTFAGTETITYTDSGASDHCFINQGDFTTYQSLDNYTSQTAQIGSKLRILGKGTVHKFINNGDHMIVLDLTNVLHTPDLAANLVSIS